jgi:phenylpyruvate tautomerase PptA (4-oxalocrotonate tautomerase family)
MQTALTSMFSTLTLAAGGQIRPIIDIYASERCSKETTVPLWKVYHPVGAYTKEDKHAFSKRITDIYSQVPLPKFYVDVVFQEIPEDSFYVGGEPARNCVRIHMDHIARQLTSEAAKTKFLARVESAIAPSSKIGGSIGNFISTRHPSTCGRSRAYDRRARGTRTRSGGFQKIDPRQERMIEAHWPAAGRPSGCD